MEFLNENIESRSYLAIRAGMWNSILQYQISMVEHNRIEGVIPFEIKHRDENICFFYNITSKVSLSFFLKRRRLKRNEFIMILDKIMRTVAGCAAYLLYESSFVIDAEYIYINPETLEISMLYVPIENGINSTAALKELVMRMILNDADIEEEGSDNFLQLILSFVKKDAFSPNEFSHFLNSLIFGREDNNGVAEVDEKSQQVVKPVKGSDDSAGKDNVKFKVGPVAIAIVSQLLILAAVIAFGRYLGEINNNKAANYIAAAMIILAIDILIFKGLFRKKTNELMANVPEMVYVPEVEYSNNTVLLSADHLNFPILRGINSDNTEEIIIEKQDFIIGRLAGQVDHMCSNNAVGKVHAQITKKEGEYFIRDMNSINGTFMNGSRLESNKDYLMNNNDKVSFANSDYVFTR